MSVLVTGGAGFIGSHLCEVLTESGHNVICLDSLCSGRMDNLSGILNTPGFSFVKADANSPDELEKVFIDGDIDTVFHYAALVGVRRTRENPIQVLEDIDGIRNILELSVKYGVKKVIYSSSSEVYGDPQRVPVKEDGPLDPRLTYAAVKLAGEKFMDAYQRARGLNYTCLRLFNVYGPRQVSSEYGFVAGIFIRQALKGEPLTVFGGGDQTRDFTYISDVVRASVLSMSVPGSSGETLNVGTGGKTTVLSLAQRIISLTESRSKLNILPPREDDINSRCADISKMERILKYRPLTGIDEGLEKTIKWFRESGALTD